MNAELVSGDEARMIIPTVYRDDYLTGLRTMSRGGEPHALIRVLDFSQRWVATLDWTTSRPPRRPWWPRTPLCVLAVASR